MKQFKRAKPKLAWLERRLYKIERRIEKFNAEALLVRQTIKLLTEQEAARRQRHIDAVNKALQDAAIKTKPVEVKGGTINASNIKAGERTIRGPVTTDRECGKPDVHPDKRD